MTALALGVVLVSSAFLLVFGLNLVHLAVRALRLRTASPAVVAPGEEPLVCVQLPIYDERYVAERVIDAACRLEWPRHRLEVQVLDDSDDDTAAIAARAVHRWRRHGVAISHLRRRSRDGYKAGALAHGLEQTEAEFLLVLDADFVPPPDLLRRTVGALADPGVGFVQARWGHLNETFSGFTRLQALMVDFHFLVEQAVRPAAGWPSNFTGTAGVWRRAAIVDAGGWSARTLTEDLDLSYRAQLRGWRAVYVEDLVVPQELPVAVAAYRGQQLRWATGSFQTARHLLLPLLTSRMPPMAKLEGALHLLGYAAPILMLAQVACYPVLLLAGGLHLPPLARVPLAVNLVSLAPAFGSAAAQARRGAGWWRRLPRILAWSFVGAGTSLTVLVALTRAFGVPRFNRTPKYRIERAGQEWREGDYVHPFDAFTPAELAAAGAMTALVAAALVAGQWLLAVYAAVFAVGFAYLGGLSLLQAVQVLTLRRLGRRAFGVATGAARAAGLLALPLALLAVFAGLGVGFEDTYQHWLAAATLATTGRLHDPLFGMEDSWLPGYQVLAAGVLKVAGTWNLAALRGLSVALSAAVLLLVHRLAGSERRGRLAVALLSLNPAFLLTGGEAVAEPLLAALLLGAVLALRERRPRTAAALAALACLTGTKAWLWLAAALAVQGLALLARPRRRAALGWAVPAIAVLALLQLGFAPATHSLDRASVEVASATARGSLALGAPGRGGAFLGWFALASLPLVVLAPLGLLHEVRAGSAAVRLLHLPALGYLAAVAVLVTAGAYSGSHRYYELALPSLALLAAAGAESLPAAGVLAAAAAAAIAIVYAPIAAAFAAENAGLLAAGRVAAAVPGSLLTDSPAAAYASRKPPAEISGSAVLPADREAAVNYLREHGFAALVLEDVSYYRASEVFPDLAAGRSEAPFQALGDQSGYQVAAGKPVSVWVLPADAFHASVAGAWLCATPAEEPRQGKTAPLEKGPVLEVDGRLVAGDGMGFGVPIARFPDGWVFPGDAVTVDLSSPGQVAWRKVYQLDRLEEDGPGGRFLDFRAVPSRGRVTVDYRVEGDRLHIAVSDAGLSAEQVLVLNEESSAFDDEADASGTRLGSALGPAVPVTGTWARLRSGALDLEWAVLDSAGGERMVAGRELDAARGLDWAGLSLELPADATGAGYDITFGRAR